jgi:menaquinone-dependent protoporphyrinogen oxidase
MKVLLAVSSRHGATAEIGRTIGEELAAQGLELVVHPLGTGEEPSDFDAAVLGSSVYAGHWERDIKDFVEEHGSSMAGKPVWLFSSGPIGDPPKPEEVPVDVGGIIELTGAREHTVFAGKLDKSKLSFGEKAIVMAFRAPDGDFRDWDQIRSWAKDIAVALG